MFPLPGRVRIKHVAEVERDAAAAARAKAALLAVNGVERVDVNTTIGSILVIKSENTDPQALVAALRKLRFRSVTHVDVEPPTEPLPSWVGKVAKLTLNAGAALILGPEVYIPLKLASAFLKDALQREVTDAKIRMEVAPLKGNVEGAKKLEAALLQRPGVKSAKVNAERGTVTLDFSTKAVTEADLRRAMTELGIVRDGAIPGDHANLARALRQTAVDLAKKLVFASARDALEENLPEAAFNAISLLV